MRFEFVVREGRETGRAITLSTGEALTFGRLKTCDVHLEDDAVSRRHCTLRAEDAGCVVADLQSVNGTYVNERRVSTCSLAPGDTLRIGATVLQLTAEPAADASTARSLSSGSLTLTTAETGPPLVRKAIDPTKLGFLSSVLAHRDRALLESTQRYLSTLHRVSDELSRASGVEALFDSILSSILEVTKGDRAAILMRDNDESGNPNPPINVLAMRTRDGTANSGNMTLSRTVVRDVLEHGISTFTHDALSDGRYGAGESVVRERIRSVMCAPMRTTDTILGVLYVDSYIAHEFNEAGLELLAAIGNLAGVALHRARLLADVENLFLDVTKAIAATLDAKDGYTHRHSERVAAFAVRLAEEMGLPPDDRASVELSGLLHDVGKIGVRDAILNKPGELTTEEFAEMRRHPMHGAAILANIQSGKIAHLLPGVKYHHERWDGSGYPEGLSGDQIPLFGRIIAVADYLDALTSDRSYRTGTPIEEVVTMLQSQSGRAFDPKVVDAAIALHRKGALMLPVAPVPTLP